MPLFSALVVPAALLGAVLDVGPVLTVAATGVEAAVWVMEQLATWPAPPLPPAAGWGGCCWEWPACFGCCRPGPGRAGCCCCACCPGGCRTRARRRRAGWTWWCSRWARARRWRCAPPAIWCSTTPARAGTAAPPWPGWWCPGCAATGCARTSP
ncbi:hypothetical protein HML84_04340 [Alcanivorax sp. IO_7]|nr:hypothetical protein HML84_04340 [Alcanivorax sp. IO_7]